MQTDRRALPNARIARTLAAAWSHTTMRYLPLLGVLVLCACQNDARFAGVDKPAAPDMQSVLDAFAMPTGTVIPETLSGLISSVLERTNVIDTLQVDQLLLASLSEGLSDLQQRGQSASQAIERGQLQVTQQPIKVQGDGFMVITRICDGWGPTPVPDVVNGTVELTAGFTEQGLDEVVWGSIFACKYQLGTHAIQLDGLDPDPRVADVRAYIGNAVTFQAAGTWTEPVIVDVAARVFVDGVEQLGRFTFKVDPTTRAFETIVPLADGNVVVSVPLDRTDAVAVRDAHGTFRCDLSARRCTAASGQVVEAP